MNIIEEIPYNRNLSYPISDGSIYVYDDGILIYEGDFLENYEAIESRLIEDWDKEYNALIINEI